MTSRAASCTCGQLNLVVEGNPVRISMCHCHDCQRRTGSVFATQAWFPEEHVSIDGTSREFIRTADSGNHIFFHFCTFCGSTVYYLAQAFPEWIAVPVGAFADSSFPQPQVSVYENRKHSWVVVPEGIEHMD